MNEPPRDVDRLPTKAGYDRWAEIYDGYDNPLVALEAPVVRELVGDVSGLRIADIGCGTGRHTVPLAMDAAQVTGVDFSEGMLARARAKVQGLPVDLIRHDLTRRLPLPSTSFDRVLSCLVLEHIHDLDAVFSEMARICKPGGFVVVTDLHPDMVRSGLGARFTDPETGRKQQMESILHPVDEYRGAALRAGLTLDQIRERAVDEQLARRSESAGKYVGMTLLLAMRFLRPG
jgi:ubiquinone/menaquinone biosynthesis C-methylase UbiE